jgi:hypothetical protein
MSGAAPVTPGSVARLHWWDSTDLVQTSPADGGGPHHRYGPARLVEAIMRD